MGGHRAPADPDASAGVHPRLRLRLFGDFGLWAGDEAVSVSSVRARTLLAYLAVHRDRPQPRQRLASILWPESTESQARTNLRNVLHLLRRAGPEINQLVEVGQSSLRWRGDATCWVDVAAFEAAVEQAGTAARPEDQLAAMRAAVDAYDGDLLEDCDDDWAVAERTRLRESYVGVLRHLAEALGDGHEYSEATTMCQELVRCEPLNEENHCLLMRIRMAAGDRAGATRAYHECVATLERELGVAPAAATRRTIAMAMDTVTPETEPDGTVAPRVTGGVLVGRDREWAALVRSWRGAKAAGARLVLVSGEPGVGKSRLASDLAAWCARQGGAVAAARSYPGEGELSYGVVIAWLRAAGLAGGLRRADRSDRSQLARLLPELGAGAVAAGGPVEQADRLRLFDAIVRVLTGTGRPVLLVADDAQWCDTASLQAMHYLIRSVVTGPLLVVATARREDIDDEHPLAGMANQLQVLERFTEIGLGRLTLPQTAQLARSLAVNLDEISAQRLYDETEGSPLFVVEAVRAGWDGSAGDVAVSPRLQAVIRSRLGRLSGPARQILGVAATVGRDFTAELVSGAGGLDDVDVAQGLDELWRRGVIRVHDTDGYDFSHAKLRDVAYDALSPMTRRRHHLAIAEAMARLRSPQVDAVSGQIAVHYEQANRAEDAIGWYRRAAVQAMRLGVHAEAVRVLDRARVLAAALSEPEGRRRELEVLSMMPAALGGVDGYASDRLAAVQQRATTLAAELGVELEPPLLRSLVMARLCRDEFTEAAQAAARLLASARRGEDGGLEIEAAYLQAISAFWGGDLASAAELFASVVERFDPDRRADHLLRFGQDPVVVCQSRLANTLWLLGRGDDARQARDVAMALADQVGDLLTSDVAHIFAALLALDLDEPDAISRHAAHFRDGRARGGPFAIKGDGLMGYADVLEGRAAHGIERIRSAIDRCGDRNPAPGFRATLTRLLVAAHAAAGDARGGIAAADQALRLGGTRLWEPEVGRLRSEFLAAVGAPAAEIDAQLHQALDLASNMGALGPTDRLLDTRRRLLG